MSCDKRYRCPVCGDRLIHQDNRGPHESSSALGQHIHDNYENVFWFMDIDAIVYKKKTRILRMFERKKANGSLRDSQRFLLPILAVCIRLLVHIGTLHRQSGVFLICADPPFDTAAVKEIKPFLPLELDEEKMLQDESLRLFFMAEELPHAT